MNRETGNPKSEIHNAQSAIRSIGIDFDNTIVCYDQVFHRAAVEQGLIPPETFPAKEPVRDYLRRCGQEDRWTELQGCVYGHYISDAPPFAGVKEFFFRCRQEGIGVYIISHKTPRPLRGPEFDLHAAARGWLQKQGFHDPRAPALPPGRVFFEETKQQKLQRIIEVGCDMFVDDLAEFLAEPEFPLGVHRVLFDPNGTGPADADFLRVSSWWELGQFVFEGRLP